jgi:predicted transcriptional regulator
VSKRPQAVTDAELAVLKVLWRSRPQTARGLTEAIYPGGAESEFASVHSFLQRLERKGLVTRDRRAAPHIFSAAVSQVDVVGSELAALADRLGDGSITPLILHLVAQKRLTKKEATEIRTILDRYAK